MEAWLGIGKDGTLWLAAGETLLKLYLAASETPGAPEHLARGPNTLPASLIMLVKGPGIDVGGAWKLLVEQTGQPKLAKFAPLLDPLDKQVAPQSVTWPILKEDITHDAKASGVSFGLKGGVTAALEFEASCRTPGDCIASGIAAPAGERLVRISASGSVQGSASARAPINIGSVAIDASADAGAKLSYFTHHPSDARFAGAILEALPHLRSPFVLSSAASFFAAFPSGIVQLDTVAGLKFAFNLSLSSPFDVGVPGKGALAIAAKARVGGTYKATLVKPDTGRPHIRLALERVASSAQEFAATIKVDLDVSAITARVKAVLARARDLNAKTAGFLAKLDPYFTPGTLLKHRIESMVREVIKDETANAIVLKALGFSAAGTPSDLLAKIVEDQINVLDKLWTCEQDAAVKALTLCINDSTGLPNAAGALGAVLTPHLGPLLAGLKRDLRDHVIKLVTDNKAFEDLQLAVNEVGSGVQGTFHTIDARAEALLGPIHKMLDKYQSTVSGLIAEIDGYVADKLKADIALLKSESATRSLDLDVIFDASSAEARALYARIFTDDLTSVFDALRNASPSAVTVQKAAFTDYLARLSSSGVHLAFGRLDFTFKKVLTAGVKFKVDANGIVEADLDQTADATAAYFHTRERVIFVSSEKLRAGHAQTATLALSVQRSARSVSHNDIEAFFAPVIAADLLPRAIAAGARSQWNEWCAKPNTAIPCQLGLTRNLADAEIMQLLQLTRDGEGIARATAPFDLRPIERTGARALVAAMFRDNLVGRRVDMLFDRLRTRGVAVGADVADGLVWAANLPTSIKYHLDHLHITAPQQAEDQLDRIQGAAKMVRGLGLALQAMREIVISKPVMGDNARAGEMTAADASRLGIEIVEDLSAWVMTDGPSFENFFGWSDHADIDAATVAFIRVLQDLTGASELKATIERIDRETMKPLDPRTLMALN